MVLSLPSGEEIVWSIQEDKPVFETLHGTLYVRCKFRRLHGADSVSVETLSTWQTEFFFEEPEAEVEEEDPVETKTPSTLSNIPITPSRVASPLMAFVILSL